MPTTMSQAGAWRRITISTNWWPLAQRKGFSQGHCNLFIHIRNDTRLPFLQPGQQQLHERINTNLSLENFSSIYYHHSMFQHSFIRPYNFQSRAFLCVGDGQSQRPLDTDFLQGPSPCGWVWYQTTSLGMTIVYHHGPWATFVPKEGPGFCNWGY
jgi:hypothetical protein